MKCELCPRKCGVDREKARGYCGMGAEISAAKAMLHRWEEPCISGERGSGAVFFSGCTLKCAYCQNYGISTENKGREITAERLAEIFLELQQQGAHNINLVNPTHFVPQVIRALETAKRSGLSLPIVYNSGGYERTETLRALDGIVDGYLPDVKYFGSDLAEALSDAPNYFDTAMSAVAEMVRQTGKPKLAENGILLRGTLVRHLVLPWQYKDSIEIVKRLAERFGGDILFSLMSQYTPFGRVKTDTRFEKFNRRITTFEYQKVLDAVYSAGLNGYMQEKSSAKEEYTPEFDFSGL
ncbi:MAG: radical SAM protein [Lachnospiraceae bacterium]|nr:radical SAM protein [Ruminococcus sp.]MCM1274507.1 radical SAM protein [Lachnospiraceae bacterium]